jgi:guanylate kinase
MINMVIVSGPSGVGKSTLIHMLIKENRELEFIVSHTTRKKRTGEKGGRDYYFVDQDTFKHMIEKKEFVEWAEVHGNFYGTSHQEIKFKSRNGKILVLDVDIQGARNLKRYYPDAWYIFVVPPSFQVLRERLMKRENKIDLYMKKRLAIAKKELKEYPLYDYVIVNDKIEIAFSDMKSIITTFKCRLVNNTTFIKEMIGRKE